MQADCAGVHEGGFDLVSYAYVMVATPSGSSWVADFAMSLAAMQGYFSNELLPGVERQRMGTVNPRSSDLIMSRTGCVQTALTAGATHILWLDSDMLFPANTLHRLFAHRKPVVAGNYAGKAKHHQVTAQNEHYPRPNGEDAVFSLGKTGLEHVKRAGMGCMLVACEVFYRIDYPFFGHSWHWMGDGEPKTRIKDPKTFPWTSWKGAFEDWFFCKRLEDGGIPLLVDHDLSNELGHYGGCVYRHGGWDNCDAGR